jgi:hypothetical protein
MDAISNLLLSHHLSTSLHLLFHIIDFMGNIKLTNYQIHVFLVLILFEVFLLLNLMLNSLLFLMLHLCYNRFSIYSSPMGSLLATHPLLNLYFMCFGKLFWKYLMKTFLIFAILFIIKLISFILTISFILISFIIFSSSSFCLAFILLLIIFSISVSLKFSQLIYFHLDFLQTKL